MDASSSERPVLDDGCCTDAVPEHDANDYEELVSYCVGRYTCLKAAFTLELPSGHCVSMTVRDLKSKTEAKVEELVKVKGGPWQLVSSWLKEKDLRRFLEGCQSPGVVKKARTEVSLPRDVDARAKQLIAAVKLIQGTQEKLEPVPSEAMAANWPLLDRVTAKNCIEVAAQNNLGRFMEKDYEKRHWKAVVVTAASGAGKSRLARESLTWIEDAIRQHVSVVSNVSMTFVNGYQLESPDMIDATDKGRSGSIAIGLRVAARLFPQLGVCGALSLDEFRRGLGENVRLCDLRTVMRASSIVGPQDKPRWVTLVMDEVLYAEHPLNRGCDGLWEGMVGAILNYMIPGDVTAPCLEDNIVLFPVMASTWTSFRRHHLSLVEKVVVPLPALSAASTMQISQLVARSHPDLVPVLDQESFMAFLTSCALFPDGLRIGLETTVKMVQGRPLDDALLAAIAKQICAGFRNLYKPCSVPPAVIEFAMSGVPIPDVVQVFEGSTFSRWLEMGFASGDVNEPLAVPFPTLANGVGHIVPAFDQFVNWGQPFYWQHVEALVPHIIRLRCSSLYRVKANRQATLREIFGSGPPTIVTLRVDMSVVTCAKQWLVKKSVNVKTPEQQLKVKSLDIAVDVGRTRVLPFGSRSHVFGAPGGNVHFDGHASFQTDDGRTVVCFYQAKHAHINPDSGKATGWFAWESIQTWLTTAREFVASFKCDVKLFVVVTNKEVRGMPVSLDDDCILVHQANLETFFAPCFLASARLAKDN